MSDPIVDAVEAVIAAGEGEPLVAPDVVNEPMIRHWVEAFGDSNPAWRDPAASPHGQVAAPPAMLGVWTMETSKNDGGPRDKALRAVEEGGFVSVVATDYEQEYLRPLTVGMRITELRSIEWIEGPKETALGTGYFVGTRYDYTDGDGELVGIARMKLLKFKPNGGS
jgi:hypothetical protein